MQGTKCAGFITLHKSRSCACLCQSAGTSVEGLENAIMHCLDTATMHSLTYRSNSLPTASACSRGILEYAFRISSYLSALKSEPTAAAFKPSLNRDWIWVLLILSRSLSMPGNCLMDSLAKASRSLTCSLTASQKLSTSMHCCILLLTWTMPWSSSRVAMSFCIRSAFRLCRTTLMLVCTNPASWSFSIRRPFFTTTVILVSSLSTAWTCCMPCTNSL
mmetsp:Transcript_33045/g.77278  ORF Transcript_33045/g.77278 Transcript_33045/m.77278 type:complete len:218 (+) Transcript_33045:1943-2596(+)